MSDAMIDRSSAGDHFDPAIIRQPRGLLTPEESRLIALGKAVDQAEYVMSRAMEAHSKAGERLNAVTRDYLLAKRTFEDAKAKLETK